MKFVVMLIAIGLLSYESKESVSTDDNDLYHYFADTIVVKPERCFSTEDFTYMCKLLNAACKNEPFMGQLAVGQLVLNRQRYYQSRGLKMTIKSVIFRPGQFDEIRSRYFHKSLKEIPDTVKRAALHALLGRKVIPDQYIYYLNPDISTDTKWVEKLKKHESIKIGLHEFFHKDKNSS